MGLLSKEERQTLPKEERKALRAKRRAERREERGPFLGIKLEVLEPLAEDLILEIVADAIPGEDKMQEVHNGKDEIAWGSQIRSYVLHPYQMVKDHRINMDIGNVNDVLDGGIDPFIEGVLLAKKHK